MTERAASRADTALIIGFVIVFLACGLYFASIQNIWIDETTQLLGAGLAPGPLLRWLAGRFDPGFGVPADRMPPVSYALDAACARTLCAAPVAFRWLHLAVAATGIVVLLRLALRRYGTGAGVVTGAIVALSPKLTDVGVEIRAYPIFFAITCLQIAAFYAAAAAPRLDRRALLPVVGLGLLAIYTHFFALVSTMALLAGLFACAVRTRRDAAHLIAAGAILLVLSAGLAPFVTGARSISGTEGAWVDPFGVGLYLLRLLGHPANVVSVGAASIFFPALGLLLATAVVRIGAALARDPRAARRDPLVGLVVALAAGIGVTIAAALVMSGFNPLKVSYSIWTLPIIALLAGTACVPTARQDYDRAAMAVTVLLIAGAGWAQILFLAHARWFVHGPVAAIQQAAGQDIRSTAFVYRGNRWAYGFYPMWYAYGANASQWLIGDDGVLHRLEKGGTVSDRVYPPDVLKDFSRLVVIAIELRSYASLREVDDDRAGVEMADGFAPPPGSPVDGMVLTAHRTLPGLYWTRIDTFEKRPR